MFITVRYGDAQQALFNPNCTTKNLLDDIKRRCQCEKNVVVDLSDELGNVKNLLENDNKHASDILKPRGIFVLIKVERNENSESPTYVPLCQDMDIVTGAFIERLSRPDSQASQRNTESRQRRKSSSSSWSRAKSVLLVSGNKNKKQSRGDKRNVQSKESSRLGLTV